jgi:hypothetical protein
MCKIYDLSHLEMICFAVYKVYNYVGFNLSMKILKNFFTDIVRIIACWA